MDVLAPDTVHVLLVDDERLSRVVVANLLRKCNYKVTVAESGTQALEALQQQAVGTFQLVLTDVMMPQVGGIDLLRFIRSHHQLGDLPVVMMSASERAEMVYECIRGGAEEYLIKPVTRKEVQNIWTHIIRRLNHPPTGAGAGAGAAGALLPAPQHATAGSNNRAQALGAAEPASTVQHQAVEPSATPAALPLQQLAPQQQQAAAPHAAGAAGPSSAAALYPASPPLRPNTPVISPAQQQQHQSQQQLASSLSMAAAATASGQQHQQHHQHQHQPWHTLALRHMNGVGTALPQQHLTTAALPQQQHHMHTLLMQRGEGGCCGGNRGDQPQAKRVRLQNGSGAPTLLGASATAANQRGGGASGQATDWFRGTRGAGAEVAGTSYGGGGAEQLGGVQGGMMVEAAGRAEREGGAQVAPLLGGFGLGSTGGEGTSVVPLSHWLARPNRVVQPKESFWIFTETLLLLEKFHAHCDASVGWLRPSSLTLSRTGRVSFAASPHTAHPHAPPQPQQVLQHHIHTQSAGRGPCGSTRTHRRAVGAAQPSRMGGALHTAASGSGEAPQGTLPVAAGAADVGMSTEGGGEDGGLGGPAYPGTGGTLSGIRRGRASPPAAGDAPPGICLSPGGAPCSRSAGGTGCACRCGHGGGSGLELVDMMYASPEEERGAPTSRQSDVFSLGVLFFELFHVANPPENLSKRLRTLSDLRQRILPPAFLKHQPKEAAFTLVLLHPDSAARPTVAELLEGDMFRNAAEALRARHSMMEAEEAALETQVLADFLRLMHQRKEEEVQHVSSQISDLTQDIQQLEAHLGIQSKGTPDAGDQQHQHQQQQLQPQRRRPRAIPSRSASFLRLGSTSSATAAAATANQHAHPSHHTPHLSSNPQIMLGDTQFPVHGRLGNNSNSNKDNRSGSEHGTTAATAAAGTAPPCVSPRTSLSAGPHPPTPQTNHGDSTGGGSRGEAGGAGEEEADATAAETAMALWPRIQSSYRQLELEYFKRRAAAQRAAESCGASECGAGEPAGVQEGMAAAAPPAAGRGAAAVPAGRAARAQQSVQQQGAPPAAAAPPLPSHIATFADDLSSYVRYDRFEVMASLQQGDLRGASQQYPVLEVSSRSRLSSVCWSSYIKAHLACSDYEGVVQLWDVNANSEIMQFEEHSKRVWSVDYSSIDPTRLVSGSDDGTIKIWTLNQESSVANIDCKANVCSVQFSPTSPHLVAAGTANCRAYLYDLRKASFPLSTTIHGHSKAVSYVRFLSGSQLVTASTDNSLKLWDLSSAGDSAQPACLTTYAGHLNERNFVGLSASQEGYLACGSETNEVYCYYKALPMPIVKHHFSARSSTCGMGSADNSSGSLDSGVPLLMLCMLYHFLGWSPPFGAEPPYVHVVNTERI
ncbi:hypothetical protein DUNSADRAFT_10078 [Dunaliella salina]|uniref:Response regulatory domain-containing protein n=1 Tax=Dunaliella salina TaxID=3046 RepID=A0ABQ7GG64_DUNSA|nr:hypothetical protein DUNSADRAFT_10078 [Dunaliella salina]|eukprot:KAF5833547.1 hypothetical protein DUNSADRAFT_10078 [Dunaliella salina]